MVRKNMVSIARNGRKMDAVQYIPDVADFPVVVFSHGYNGYLGDFAAEAEFLAEHGVGAVTFTFCGSGVHDRSGFPTTEMTLFTEREDLFAVMKHVCSMTGYNGKLVLFGGSQGGMVSWLAATERKEDVSGLALLYPAFCIPDNWREKLPGSIPDCLDFWGVKLGRDFFVTARGLDVYSPMRDFDKPVLLLHGEKDAVVPLSYSERAACAFPDAGLVVYPREGHGFSADGMKDVSKRLLAFVRGLQ